MKHAALLLWALFPVAVASEPAHHVVIHGVSKHTTKFDSHTGRDRNEVNAGLGYRREYSPEFGVQVGAYHNSQRRVSTYAMADWTPLEVAGVRLGGSLGLVSGYDVAPIVPAAAAIARLTVDRFAVTVRYLPPIVPKFTSVAAVEFSWRF